MEIDVQKSQTHGHVPYHPHKEENGSEVGFIGAEEALRFSPIASKTVQLCASPASNVGLSDNTDNATLFWSTETTIIIH